MKSEKGITLISLITYITVLLLAISVITLMTNFFINNLNEAENTSENMVEINKFDLSFLSDIKQEGISVYNVSEQSIILEDRAGNDIQYIYENNSIYRIENGTQKIKINENITGFSASLEGNKISIIMSINDTDISKEYKLGKY